MQSMLVKIPIVVGLIDFDLQCQIQLKSPNFINVQFVQQSKFATTRVNTKTIFDLLGWGWGGSVRGSSVCVWVGGGGAVHHSPPMNLLFGAVYWSRQPRVFQRLSLLFFVFILPIICWITYWHLDNWSVISKLKNGAPGRDKILPKHLKCMSESIAHPLSKIANFSFEQGVFPDDLKIAVVSPVYKAKDPMYFNSYRPISLLSVFSKILERLMYNRLLKFIDKNNLLNEFQFGFRNNHSTLHLWLS